MRLSSPFVGTDKFMSTKLAYDNSIIARQFYLRTRHSLEASASDYFTLTSFMMRPEMFQSWT